MSAVGRDPDGFGVVVTEPADPRVLGLHRHLLVSERLRWRRRQLGLTQKEVVARLRRLGVDTTNKALSSLEHGAGLDVCKLPELARALDCTLTYLVGLSSDPRSWEPDGVWWPRDVATTELPPEEQVSSMALTNVPDPDERAHQSDGPWILGPAPNLRRRQR
jgi:transcriptional regulator with XRE-family HTH domain